MESEKSTKSPLCPSENGKDPSRFAFFPIKYPLLEKFYHEQKRVYWTAQEISFKDDRDHWDQLDTPSKTYIKFILFLFAQLDGIVNENLVENFKRETSVMAKECSMFYAIQEAVEWTHNETYSLLIKSFIRDPREQAEGLNSIEHYPAIGEIAKWAFFWMNGEKPLLKRLIAFMCIEGVVFSSAFAGIYWIKRRNILHGLTKANEWIARDESIHTNFAISLYYHITSIWKSHPPLTSNEVKEIISSAVDVTEKFTRTAMNVHLVGLSEDHMVDYVKNTADRLSESLGCEPIYGVINPLEWMAVISLPNKTNFFESVVTEYGREGDEFDFDLNVPF